MAKLLEWSFDEASGVAVDHSGNGRDLTISGNTARTLDTEGHTLKGLTQSAATITTGPSLTGLQTTARTVMFWIRITTSITGWVMEFHRSAEDTGVWGLLYLSGTLRFRAKNSSNTVFDSPSIAPDFGNWHHLAATHDGANLRVYRDGVLASTTAMAFAVWDAQNFRVLDQTGSAIRIDDPRYFDSALSQSEIATWMATPAGASVNQGTLAGSFSSPTADITGGSIPSDPGAIDGAFSSPAIDLNATATAQVTVDGTFAAPVTALDTESTASAELAGDFASPTFSSEGSSAGLNTAELAGDFAAPTVAASGNASTDVSMIGTFSIPVFAGSGGVPIPDRDILVTIRPGDSSTTSIAAGPERISVTAGDFRRTEIGA
jgi:hypothetical protein